MTQGGIYGWLPWNTCIMRSDDDVRSPRDVDAQDDMSGHMSHARGTCAGTSYRAPPTSAPPFTRALLVRRTIEERAGNHRPSVAPRSAVYSRELFAFPAGRTSSHESHMTLKQLSAAMALLAALG